MHSVFGFWFETLWYLAWVGFGDEFVIFVGGVAFVLDAVSVFMVKWCGIMLSFRFGSY